MKQQQAFKLKRKMLKGGLHCHTTRSDGKVAPDEVIRIHKQNGYDFLAITDHRNYNYINYAPETGLTIIPGMEFDNQIDSGHGCRHFHTLCIGPKKEDGNGFEQDVVLERGKAKDQFEYQSFLDKAHNNKNLTVYCHPEWSSTPAKCFEKQKGNFAMEIWNSGSAINCDMDTDAAYWDELLGQGINIYGVATDDGHALSEHCNGWVMVNAENNVNDILRALEAGEFYSTCGPEIYDFYIEDNKAVIECSNVAKIRLQSDKHPARMVKSEDGSLTRAEFELKHWAGPYSYVRITVVDKNGNKAWTNPIFLEKT